jgi:hypothetical protein
MKMSITTQNGASGCRQFRWAESQTDKPFYYSTWIFIPQNYQVNGWWNLVQFKSKTSTNNDPIWVLEPMTRSNGTLGLRLRYSGYVPGPQAGGKTGLQFYYQDLKDLPVGRWFHLETYLRPSGGYDGQITVWQDGTQIFDMNNVNTRYSNGDQQWSVNMYGDKLNPEPATVYVDDAKISTGRIGPN